MSTQQRQRQCRGGRRRHALLLLFTLVTVPAVVGAADPASGDGGATTTPKQAELEPQYQKRGHHHHKHRPHWQLQLVNPLSCQQQPPPIPDAIAFACALPVRNGQQCVTTCQPGYVGSPSALCVKSAWIQTNDTCRLNTTLLTFDDLSDVVPLQSGYGGLNWGTFAARDGPEAAVQLNCSTVGYYTGMKSANMTIFADTNDSPQITARPGTTFTILSLWATPAYLDMTLGVQGYAEDGTPIGPVNARLDSAAPTLVDLSSLANVTKLIFGSAAAACEPWSPCAECFAFNEWGREVVLDNMEVVVYEL